MINFGNNFNLVIICWIIFFLYWLVSAFFVKQSATKRNWKVEVIWRVIVAVLVIILFKFNKPGATSFFTFLFFHNFLSYVTLGAVLTVLGLITAIWARIILGRNWSNYVTFKKEHELVTNGPYKFIRHPIYSGVVLMLIGTFLSYGDLIILVIIAMVILMLAWRMGREEKIMIKLFGKKYTGYMERTKRLIPWIY